MDYIKEPQGVDFLVAPIILTEDDAHAIKMAIASYRKEKITISDKNLTQQQTVCEQAKSMAKK